MNFQKSIFHKSTWISIRWRLGHVVLKKPLLCNRSNLLLLCNAKLTEKVKVSLTNVAGVHHGHPMLIYDTLLFPLIYHTVLYKLSGNIINRVIHSSAEPVIVYNHHSLLWHRFKRIELFFNGSRAGGGAALHFMVFTLKNYVFKL